MTNKDFKEMLEMLRRLMKLVDDYESTPKDLREDNPIMIPPDVYDEICDSLKQKNITLFGVS